MALFEQTARVRTVYESDYHRVVRHDDYLRMARSEEPYPDLQAIEAEYEALVDAIAPYKERELGLLVDLRDARGRNDPGFEKVHARWRRHSLEGHEPLVVLVRTMPGRMHVERHMRADGLPAVVVTDEGEALRLVGGRVSGIVSQEKP